MPRSTRRTPLDRMAERSESEKLTHAEVGYRRVSNHTGETCDNCRHVIEAMSGNR